MSARRHWHVHSFVPGYLCECDAHYPMSASERDAALRYERDGWRDYATDVPSRIRITGSVRSGAYYIDDPDSIAWCRAVESWECSEAGCWEGMNE